MNDCNVGRSPGLHTGMNLFVCNMALSDIMMSLTAAPLTPLTRYTKLRTAVNEHSRSSTVRLNTVDRVLL